MTLEDLDIAGKKYFENFQMTEALQCYALAFIDNPELGMAYNNYGNILRAIGKPRVSYEFFKLAIKYGCDLAPFNLAIAYLTAGDMEEGWQQFEERWNFGHQIGTYPNKKQPHWEGEDLKGKSILITCEQGDGDNLQFIRFVKELYEMGAKIYVETEPSLKRLYRASLSSDIEVSTNKENLISPPDTDYWVSILSLPRILKINYNTLPLMYEYLTAGKETIEEWKNILPERSGKMRVGICWKGRTRSMPLDDIINLIEDNPQYEWINLCGSSTNNEVQELKSIGVQTYFDKITDWKDTAGLMEHIDIVVTVDTGLCHLAGAMSKPTLLMLNKYGTCWRWLLDKDTTQWYPSFRLIRQTDPHVWTDVLSKVEKYLALHKV